MNNNHFPATVPQLLEISIAITISVARILFPFGAVLIGISLLPEIAWINESVLRQVGFSIVRILLSIAVGIVFFYLSVIASSDLWKGMNLRSLREYVSDIDEVRLGKLIVLNVYITVMTILFAFLFVIPGLVYLCNRYLASFSILLGENSLRNSLSESKKYMTLGAWYSLTSPMSRITGIFLVILLMSGLLVATWSVWEIYAVWYHLTGEFAGKVLYRIVEFILSLYTTVISVGFYYDLESRYKEIN